MNGKTYREVQQHMTYCITKKSHYSMHSLEDRGDNDGVTGSVVRVIETHTNRKVDIIGIENHEITSITLVTAGEVISTISGEVTLIIYKYAHHGKIKTINSSHQIEH